ncbi:MAG: hypothetical protein SWY16_16795 [Cyanobacteriota bacterium]|nr:hypothetical protein [Cyanobacteriota bacterium]
MFVPDFDRLLEQLNAIVPQLTATRLMLLNRMASALQVQLSCSSNPNSDFATPRFCEYFASRLLIHHAVVEEKLNKKSFEYIFRDALRHDGRTADLTASNIHPGADLVMGETRISLKTEASKRIRENKITISKLMEARWVRGRNARDLAQLASARLSEHLAGYDRIMMLRAFSLATHQVRYDLIEIPHHLLALAIDLETDDITLNPGRNGGGSALIRQHDREAFTLRFDGSVEKVTIANLLAELCTIHVTWSVPLTFFNFDS